MHRHWDSVLEIAMHVPLLRHGFIKQAFMVVVVVVVVVVVSVVVVEVVVVIAWYIQIKKKEKIFK